MADSVIKHRAVRLLIVEDEKVTATLAGAMCHDLGYEVQIVRDGELALDAFEHFRPDLILMDLQLPILGGFEAAHGIRLMEQEHGLASVPIIAVTGHPVQENHAKALRCGMNECIEKPYTQAMIQSLVEKFIPSRTPHFNAKTGTL